MMRMNTFLGRLSLSFIALLLIGSGFVALVIYRKAIEVQDQVQQQLQWGLAELLAQDFREHLIPTLRKNELERAFGSFCLRNPRVDLYLLDNQGNILVGTGRTRRSSVRLEPLQRFLSQKGVRKTTLAGDDPKSWNRETIFSVSRTAIGEGHGYLYAVLRAGRMNAVIQMYRDPLAAENSLWTVLLVLAGTSLVSVITAYVITGRFRRLTGFVERYRSGDYSTRVDESGSDEISTLAQALNVMASTIEANISQLQNTDTLRRALIANISHDLRIPLSVIRTGLDTLLMELPSLSEADARKLLEQTVTNVDFLNLLITQLFELSKLEARQEEPEIVVFSIVELAEDVVYKFQPRAAAKEVRLLVECTEQVRFAHGDIGLLDRVLSNLIINALQHTPEGGQVTLRLTREEQTVVVEVADTGPGMTEAELERVFERFYRAPSTRSAAPSGAGLGLAIAFQIMQLHGTRLIAQSEKGNGATFRFELPAADRLV